MMAATTPMKILCGMATKPAAGVMATRPTTAPIQNPSTEGFLPLITSKNIQDKPAAAAAVLVVANAETESAVGSSCRTCIKSKPAKPEQTGTDQNIRNISRWNFFMINMTSALFQNHGACQSRTTGRNMYHSTTGKIQCSPF